MILSTPPPDSKTPKLLDQLREQIRLRHYSIRTETAYVQWVRRFIIYHNKLSALLFLSRDVLKHSLPWLDEVVRAKRPSRLPVVLTQTEVAAVLERMTGMYALPVRLLYGTGMRLMEVVRLRVKLCHAPTASGL